MGSGLDFVDISSDEDDRGMDKPGGGGGGALDWLKELLDVEGGGEGKGGSEEVIVVGELSAPAAKRRKGSNSPSAKRGCGGGDGDDDDCLILEVDPDGPVATVGGEKATGGIEDDELLIVAEKGELACRDYPHPRHSCANFPFDSTSHKDHCNLCHCYVCDSLAPCKYWGNGSVSTDHCHSTDKIGMWKSLRQRFKRTNMPSSQSQNVLGNIILPCQNQVSSQCFPRPVFSSTSNPRPNVLQPCSGINTANLGSIIQGHYARSSIFSHRTRSGLQPAMSQQSSIGTEFMQKDHSIVNASSAPISYFRTRYKRGGTTHTGYRSLNTNQHHSVHSVNKHMQNNVLEKSSTAAATSLRHLHQQVQLQKPQNSLVRSANVSMGHIRNTQSRSYLVPSTMQRSQHDSFIDGAESWQEILASVASDLGVSSNISNNITGTEQPVAISVQSLQSAQEHPQTNTNQNINICGQTLPAVGEFTMVQELQKTQGENLQQSSNHLLNANTTGFNSDIGKTHLDRLLHAVEKELFSL